MDGILVVDKPTGLSSATAVDRVKHLLKVARAGHGGTLDPLATGVLPVCLGGGTKLAQYLLADDKEYEAEGWLGVETDTLDRTGQVIARRDVSVTREAFEAAIADHRGELAQIPPMYSAIKLDGVRMYHRARAGEDIERAARKIRIDRLELLAFEPPRFRIAIACSKGTYIRSLVADLGTAVGAGAHLTELRRTRSGRFTLAQAVPLHGLEQLDLAAHLIPMHLATDLPKVTAPDAMLVQIRNAVQLPFETWGAEHPERFMLVREDGRLVAIVHGQDGKTIFDRVFPESFTA